MNKALNIALLSASLAMVHCGPDRVAGGAGAGNPPLGEVSLALKATSATALPLGKNSAAKNSVGKSSTGKTSAPALVNPDGSFTIGDSLGNLAILDSIVARVDGIDFTLPDSVQCSAFSGLPCSDGEASVQGPFSVDLMRGISHPPFSLIKIPAGIYKKIAFELISNEPDSGGTWDSTTQNIVVWGRMAVTGRRFVVRLNLREGMDFENPDGIGIKANTLNLVQLGLTVDGWFKGADLRTCVDGAPAEADSVGIARLQGDGFCAGTGKRVRMNIEFSGGFDNQEKVEQP